MGAPDEMLNAAGFSDSPHLFYSGMMRKANGSNYFKLVLVGFLEDRLAMSPDGHSLWPAFTNVPNEFIEAYFPLRVEKYETIIDSGGPGLHRGETDYVLPTGF